MSIFFDLDAIYGVEGIPTTRMWNVVNEKWEVAKVGEEYLSPNQHGSIYGAIYRQYFGTTLPSNLTSGDNVSQLLDYYVFWYDGDETRWISQGATSTFGTYYYSLYLDSWTGNGNIAVDTSGDPVVINGWVDYTK